MRNRVFLALVLCLTLVTTGFAQNKKAAKVNLEEQIKLNGKVRTGKRFILRGEKCYLYVIQNAQLARRLKNG